MINEIYSNTISFYVTIDLFFDIDFFTKMLYGGQNKFIAEIIINKHINYKNKINL